MMLEYTPYVGVLLFNSLVSVFLAFLVLRQRNTPGKAALTLLMAAALELSITNTLEVASVDMAAKIFWAKLEYVGTQSGPVLFLMFALEYTYQSEWLRSRNILLLWLVPLASMIMAATNELHKLIWTSITFNPLYPAILIYQHGFWFGLCTFYGYVMILGGSFALLRAAIRVPQLFRRQMGILLAAVLVPGIGNVIYLLGWTPVVGLDTAPFTFTLAGLVLSFGIYRFGLFDLVPVARGVLIENMSDGVLVLDKQNRVVDINPVVQRLSGKPSKEAIGQAVTAILPFWSLLPPRERNAIELQMEVCASEKPARYYDLHVTPLRDHRKHYLGKLVILRDTTQRHRTEAELARTVEELRIINRISLAVTSGLDLELVLKTLHEQCHQVAPIDVFYIALCDENSSLVHIPLFYDEEKYQTGPSRDINEQPGILGNVIRGKQTIYLHDNLNPVTRPLVLDGTEPRRPILSYIGIPLTVRERVIGAMSVQSRQPDAYTQDQIRLLEHIAIQAAIAIENARLYSEEQRLAIVDELTGIYNYRGLVEIGTREIERARRFKRPLCALFFDIDNFRKFNNTYSHATGNLILQTVAQRCRTTMRSVDVIARFGGDEFAALLPETTLEEGQEVARRLVDEIATTHITTSYGSLGVTISIGVTSLTDDLPDLFKLIDRANQGERLAKESNPGGMMVVR
jgi:diguanylate cyclase (GGDEF)-like protein/PAS domain S-box-containing protein